METWASQACSGLSDEEAHTADFRPQAGRVTTSRWIAPLISHFSALGIFTFKSHGLLSQERCCPICTSLLLFFCLSHVWPLSQPSTPQLLFLGPQPNPLGFEWASSLPKHIELGSWDCQRNIYCRALQELFAALGFGECLLYYNRTCWLKGGAGRKWESQNILSLPIFWVKSFWRDGLEE